MATSWVTLSEADVLLAMPTDIRTLYDAWIAANPDKSDSLGRIRADTIAAIRTAIYTNKENTLDPDTEKIPQDLRPTALDLITVRLAMEAGIQLSGAATQVRNDADQLLRQISYGRWRVETPGYEPSPRYTPATRTRNALPALIAVMLAVLTNADAAFTTTGSGSTINVGNVAVTNNILISNTVNVVGTTITNSFAPVNNVSNSITNSFAPVNNVTNTIANTITNSFAPVNNVTNAVTTVVTNSFAPQNFITNTFTLDAGISITNNFGDTIINATSQVNVAGVVITNIVQINNPGIAALNSATTGGVFIVVSNGWDAGITSNGNIFTITTGLPRGATGVNQVATWDGTNWIATALGAPTPTPAVGTNVIKWTTVWGVTNVWVAPSTQIMFTAWGGTGAAGSGGGGHSRAIWVGSAGTIFDIVVASAPAAASSNNGPFAGSGINTGTTNYPNGGGATYIAISGTTNIILIAGGSGGGGQSSGVGGPGGGFWFGYGDGTLTATNVLAGQGAWASNEYGLAATAGTNTAITTTNFMQNGGYLRGGHASTNGSTASINPPLGGGGGGWYGGSGAARTNATSGSSLGGAGGGGGLGYADTNYVIFAQIIAGERGATGAPAGQDHPTYTSGRGVGAIQGTTAGSAGCAGAMW